MRAMNDVAHRRQGLSKLILTVGLSAAPLAAVRADDLPPPQPAHAVGGFESDAFLEKKVNAALAADPTLARINLLVTVYDRVAVVGGPVSDPAHIPRVEAVVKAVPGLSAVKVSCWSEAGDDGPTVKPPMPTAVAANPAIPPLAHAGPVIASPPSSAAPPLPGVEPPPPAADPNSRIAAKVPVDHSSGFLLDPIPVIRRPIKGGIARMPDLDPRPKTIPPTAVPVMPVSDVKPTADRIAALQAAHKRYAGLKVGLRDGTAVVSGGPGRSSDAWALAEALRVVPGIARVVVQ